MSALDPSEQKCSAPTSIEGDALRKPVDEAVVNTRSSDLRDVRLASGVFVAEGLRRFVRDLDAYAKATSAQKRSDTRARASSTGSDVGWAVRDMQQRMADEKERLERFWIDDLIPSSQRLGERAEIRDGFQWRPRTAPVSAAD